MNAKTHREIGNVDARRRWPFVAFIALCPLLVAPARLEAQPAGRDWPQQQVRLIVPLPPGSGTDLAARLIAERLTARWGQPVVVENRQGADGIPAVTALLSARDNHTFLLSFAGVITINPFLHDKLPYDPGRDLVPIVPVLDAFLGVSATASLNARSIADLASAASALPGKLNWAATPGLPRYIMLALQKRLALDMIEIAYRDFAPAYQDLTQGRLHVAATGVPTLAPHHLAGTARLLFIANRERSPQAPDVPTAAESGYADLSFEGTVGLYGPRDVSPDSRTRLEMDLAAIATDTDFRNRLIATGSVARTGTAKDFIAMIEEQRSKIAAIHRASVKDAP